MINDEFLHNMLRQRITVTINGDLFKNFKTSQVRKKRVRNNNNNNTFGLNTLTLPHLH